MFRAVMPLATRSRALALMARYEEGLADSDRALGLARTIGYPEGECYALWQRTSPLVGVGRIDEAAQAAVTIAERLVNSVAAGALAETGAVGHESTVPRLRTLASGGSAPAAVPG
jgi:hypothetical protein